MNKVLIHICCAHCAAYTAEYWRNQGNEVAGFWYNRRAMLAADVAR